MARRLFVGNLPYSCTEDEIRALFEPRWPVREVRIVTDRETGRPRGFGFVELVQPDAKPAIDALDGRELRGRRLAVREANERQGAGKPAGKKGPPKERPISVDTVVTRRSGFRGAGAPRDLARNTSRRWQAPLEPDELEVWGAGKSENEAPDS